MWKYGLKTKLVASFALMSLVAIVVAGASTLISMRRIAEQEIQNKLLLLADAKEGQIFAYLDSLESRTLDFSSDGFIRDSLKKINEGNPQATEALNEHLTKNKKILDPALVGVFVMDKEGTVVASTLPEKMGKNKKEDACFVRGSKEVATIDPQGDEYPDLASPPLEVAAPLTDNDTGEFLGVIANVFYTEKLGGILSGQYQVQKGAISSSFGRSETLAFHLINKEKKILAHGLEETEHASGSIDTLPVQKCLGSQEEITGIYTNHFGEEVVGASMCFPRRGWTLLAEIDAREALAPVRNTTYGLVIMLGLVLIFVVLDIYLIAGNIIKPIEKLHEASDIIAQGNLEYKAVIRTGDEIEQLSHAFNQMVVNLKYSRDEIQEYSKELEKKVAEKTKDLQSKVEDLNKAQEAVLNVAEDAEEARQIAAREKDKIDAILHSIGDGVFVVDSDLNIVMVNHVTEEVSGFSEKELVGRKYNSVLKFIFEDSGKVNDKFIKEAISTGQTQEMANHILLLRKDGSKVPVADSAALLKDQKGKVIGCVVVFRDVTKEREVDKAKTEFVSLASHQLRTPLSTVNWYSEMLLAGDAGKLNEEQKKYLEEIYKGNKRMVELVSALLNVSRLELGTFSIEPEPVNLEKIARSVLKEIAPDVSQKKIKLVKNFSSDVPDIQADRSLTRMIFQNLLTNAVKYTPDGGTVTLDIGKKDNGILIRIQDTGYGIPQSQQDRIFSKFFRADNVRQRDSEGTGLGLYIVKSILDQTGGAIRFESAENKETVFYVTLPLEGMKKKEGPRALV
ncbi:MAG: hypothetical protein A3J76_05610 [Candidatus Moranbacteria bacterium RBG_13_45_13]|nr:MAG: hypothetical protein A3J76_05610 [Candidatus Moranbacteria bacterium RBG_13_45_13]